MRKIAFVLLITFSLMCIVRPVNAVLPAIMTPEVISVVAGVLTAAGITFYTSDGARAAAEQVWDRLSDNVKMKILAARTAGTLILNPTEWREVQVAATNVIDEYVTVHMQVGEGSGGHYFYDHGTYEVNLGMYPGILAASTGRVRWEYVSPNSVGGRYLCCELAGSGNEGYYVYAGLRRSSGTPYRYQLCIEVVRQHSGTSVYPISEWFSENGIDDVEMIVKTAMTGMRDFEVQVFSPVGNMEVLITSGPVVLEKFRCTGLAGTICTYAVAEALHVAQVMGTTYEIDSAYFNNPSWDLSDRQIVIPLSLDAILGKSASDMTIGDVVAPPGIGSEAGTETGWLSNIYNKLAALPGQIQGMIEGLKTLLEKIVGYLNPASETFFLRTAFVPAEGYLTSAFTEIRTAWNTKMGGSIFDKEFGWYEEEPEFMVTIGGNVLPEVSFSVVNQDIMSSGRDKIRFWLGGIMVFLTFLFLVKRIPQLLKG